MTIRICVNGACRKNPISRQAIICVYLKRMAYAVTTEICVHGDFRKVMQQMVLAKCL